MQNLAVGMQNKIERLVFNSIESARIEDLTQNSVTLSMNLSMISSVLYNSSKNYSVIKNSIETNLGNYCPNIFVSVNILKIDVISFNLLTSIVLTTSIAPKMTSTEQALSNYTLKPYTTKFLVSTIKSNLSRKLKSRHKGFFIQTKNFSVKRRYSTKIKFPKMHVSTKSNEINPIQTTCLLSRIFSNETINRLILSSVIPITTLFFFTELPVEIDKVEEKENTVSQNTTVFKKESTNTRAQKNNLESVENQFTINSTFFKRNILSNLNETSTKINSMISVVKTCHK